MSASEAQQKLTHSCHAWRCRELVEPRRLMCPAHWRKLPAGLKAAVWREYRAGQERTKRPTDRYLAVLQLCRAASVETDDEELRKKAVAHHESIAEYFRKRAIESGDGDPFEELGGL